ncbi:ABC-ATPase domain-containing protein [Staphylococcus cohnii]|uniref:ABC-ATPase domain-containing protein n=2 Tax=Staphylococcus cohnii TaxID=29382 RepID=A0ABT6J2J4_9STAP|nr:ABC-ATPase domain-containing protein [Staphylococcus cohnii]TGP64625.1 ATPase [bacterium M00.F.Ca.ET.229.01.1.1]TGS41118.1 ATPase [bacterium M00.F.Ca.ET.180.01.1.1]AYX91001.1 ATPase [Staphylococcus cohnii]MCI2942062.1 ABC-ATPase domain-containing protein [Staphylococcus cohnii]MDE1710550.1 ABC-ATPase domain-containing protein [Staphylococcus cohnii]
MKNTLEFGKLLKSLDGQKYGAYKRLKGEYAFDKFHLIIDHIQADPYAPPSKVRAKMQRHIANIPDELLDTENKKIAVSDFLTRAFSKSISKVLKSDQVSKKRPDIFIDHCGQEILQRTSVVITHSEIEVRFEVGLPAAGRKILGKVAHHIFIDLLPEIVEKALLYKHINRAALNEQVTTMIDQVFIRNALSRQNLVAFVANDSILPRKSGVSDTPLPDAVTFQSPQEFEIQLNLPSGKTVSGMGIPKGITLIVGGGFHGKSTLLEALERGVYHHIPGDGRELIITCDDAMKIRAEDGRNIEKVNIEPFINNLPGKKDTIQFSTENASGSTSQAANVIEALESQASLLLIDEDTSATNFMIRDSRMQKLIAPEKEPITPFAMKVKSLYHDYHVSTILIVGGSGDYFDVADQVLMMDEYVLKDVTRKAKAIASEDSHSKDEASLSQFGQTSQRIPLKSSFSNKGKDRRFKVKGMHTILYGKERINISGLEQLVDASQTNCIATMIDYYQSNLLNEQDTTSQAADKIFDLISDKGLDIISPHQGHPGNLALPRKQEFCGALNRYRGLNIKTH